MKKVYANDDFADFFMATAPAGSMNEERLKKQIDFYAERGGIHAILFNLNAGRAFFDSRTRTPIWEGFKPEGEKDGTYMGVPQNRNLCNWAKNCRALYNNVKDPNAFRYDYCHRLGVEMWISMRMNDIHFSDHEDWILHDDFRRGRMDRRRAAWRGPNWKANTLDYARDDVFQHNFELVKEYFERFDMDGFELDWMRTPPHTRPGMPDQGRSALTEFMRRTREEADRAAARRGHPIRIGVRVMNTPENSWNAGMDAETWAREGLADLFVPSPYFHSTCHDTPVELWKKLLGPKAEVAPCLEDHIGMAKTLPPLTDIFADTGFAASFYGRGADSLYLYNHFPGNGYIPQLLEPGIWNEKEFPLPPLPYAEGRETQKEFYSIAGNYRELCRRARRHVFTCSEDSFSEYGHQNAWYIPPNASDCIAAFDLAEVGKDRTGRIFLGFPDSSQENASQPKVFCNGEPCRFDPAAVFPHFVPLDYSSHALTMQCFEIPPKVLHDRMNTVEVLGARPGVPLDLSWLELDLDPAKENG